jgi:hypothetical protein
MHPGNLNLKRVLVAGAAAATNIAVVGMKYNSNVVAVIHHTAGAVPVDLTSELSQTDGNIQLSTTATTSDVLDVLFYVA